MAIIIKYFGVAVFFSVSEHVWISLNITVTPNVTPEMKII